MKNILIILILTLLFMNSEAKGLGDSITRVHLVKTVIEVPDSMPDLPYLFTYCDSFSNVHLTPFGKIGSRYVFNIITTQEFPTYCTFETSQIEELFFVVEEIMHFRHTHPLPMTPVYLSFNLHVPGEKEDVIKSKIELSLEPVTSVDGHIQLFACLKTEDILFMKEGKSFEILSTKHYLEPYYVFNFFKDRLRFGLVAQMN